MHTRFVWLMGADNLAQFHQMERLAPDYRNNPNVGIIARPDARLSPISARAARIYRDARVSAKHSCIVGAFVWSGVVLCEYAAYAHFFQLRFDLGLDL